ncbi:unnamed protein product [Owenia fusiformis]|uniref:Uncharacterized protein n=1 Tax=Owenia fusiformis TaxID=6347 RepID=A0A8J1XYE1_OWEFU|nr:unnamed protein product [Owenia fusiformis]
MNVVPNPRKVLRSPSLKRKSKPIPLSDRVTLERVLGLTVSSSASLTCDPNTGTIAYPAGCVIVLFHPKKNKQSHIFNTSRKTLTCLSFSSDGKYIVTGEYGHLPCVRVWDVVEKTQLAEFMGHKFGISCVAFSPNLRYIVSIGTQHDMGVNVFEWKVNRKVCSNKVSSKVKGVAFSENGQQFATIGNRHVRFWYLESSKSKIKGETLPLVGRNGILGEQRNNCFMDGAYGKGQNSEVLYVITQSGLLCEFNEQRLLDKWVELRTSQAFCMSVGEDAIYIGCSDGIVRIFDSYNLHFVATMPRPHYLGVDVSQGLEPRHLVEYPDNAKFPQTVAIAFDDVSNKVTCVYSDHSLYMWDVTDVKKIGKVWSFLYHSQCIWDIDTYPDIKEGHDALPKGSFITASGDNTIRIWNLESNMQTDTAYRRNIYSNELVKIVYLDGNREHLCDENSNVAGTTDKTDAAEAKVGVRTLKISPSGQQLASGDRCGNIRVHNLQFMEQMAYVEAHDSEVLCLEYTKQTKGANFLASASRDRLLHVFDVEQDYGLIQTLDDHSSSITAVRFSENEGQIKLLSCGADKSILFRHAQMNPDFQFVLQEHLVGKNTLYDMDIDPTHKFVTTACQDRKLRIYNIKTGKQKKCYKGALADDGTLIKVSIDPTGMFAATSCSDKSLCVYDFYSGEIAASMFGHSEIATGVKFSNDLRHLISVSGDGCIFVWRLAPEVTNQMLNRRSDMGQATFDVKTENPKRETFVTVPNVLERLGRSPEPEDFPVQTLKEPSPIPHETSPKPDFQLEVGDLPSWAKKQIQAEQFQEPEENVPGAVPARGAWAQRLENEGVLTVKSVMDDNPMVNPMSALERRRYTIEPEQHISDIRRDTMIISRDHRASNVPIISDVDNEGDDEDDEFFPPQSREQLERKLQRGSSFDSDSSITFRSAYATQEEDADDDETEEVIYYPPSRVSISDGTQNSFTVTESIGGRQREGLKNDDGDSENTQESDEEMDDMMSPGSSDPNTPMESGTPGQFLKTNFESLSTAGEPNLGQEQFGNKIESLEPSYPNHRLSISSRFLSRSQATHLSSNIVPNNAQSTMIRRNLYNQAVQRGNEEEAEAKRVEQARVEAEARERLAALQWAPKGGSEDSTHTPGDNAEEFPVKLRNRDHINKDVSKRQSTDGHLVKSVSKANLNRRSLGPTSMTPTSVSDKPVPSYMRQTSTSRAKRGQNSKENTPTTTTTGLSRARSVQSLDQVGTGSGNGSDPRKVQNLPKKRTLRSTRLSSRLSNAMSTPDLSQIGTGKDDDMKVVDIDIDSVSDPETKQKARSKSTSDPNTGIHKYSLRSRRSELPKNENLNNLSSSSEDVSQGSFKDVFTKPSKKPSRKLPSTDGLKVGERASEILRSGSDSSQSSTSGLLDSKTKGATEPFQNSGDRLAMPPPPNANVARSKQDLFLKRSADASRSRSNKNLSLSEAKDILLGKSNDKLPPRPTTQKDQEASKAEPLKTRPRSRSQRHLSNPNPLEIHLAQQKIRQQAENNTDDLPVKEPSSNLRKNMSMSLADLSQSPSKRSSTIGVAEKNVISTIHNILNVIGDQRRAKTSDKPDKISPKKPARPNEAGDAAERKESVAQKRKREPDRRHTVGITKTTLAAARQISTRSSPTATRPTTLLNNSEKSPAAQNVKSTRHSTNQKTYSPTSPKITSPRKGEINSNTLASPSTPSRVLSPPTSHSTPSNVQTPPSTPTRVQSSHSTPTRAQSPPKSHSTLNNVQSPPSTPTRVVTSHSTPTRVESPPTLDSTPNNVQSPPSTPIRIESQPGPYSTPIGVQSPPIIDRTAEHNIPEKPDIPSSNDTKSDSNVSPVKQIIKKTSTDKPATISASTIQNRVRMTESPQRSPRASTPDGKRHITVIRVDTAASKHKLKSLEAYKVQPKSGEGSLTRSRSFAAGDSMSQLSRSSTPVSQTSRSSTPVSQASRSSTPVSQISRESTPLSQVSSPPSVSSQSSLTPASSRSPTPDIPSKMPTQTVEDGKGKVQDHSRTTRSTNLWGAENADIWITPAIPEHREVGKLKPDTEASVAACEHLVNNMKDVVSQATNMYFKVLKNSDNTEQSNKMKTVLSEAFEEVHESIAMATGKATETTRNDIKPDEEMKKLQESIVEAALGAVMPLMHNYSEKLSQRVYSLVQEKMENEVSRDYDCDT